jgi:guanosine-3',5'-bis(diphosphate) 3'-pyrophosphohydrolase
MVGLSNFPGLEALCASLSYIRNTYNIASDICQDRKRLSGRPVIDHCSETLQFASRYTTDPTCHKAALLHDMIEDFGLSFEDVKAISGRDGHRVAHMVTILSKRADLKNKEERNREYMDRLAKAISEEDQGIGIIKLADRLSNLVDLKYLPPARREAIARQTLHFYVPIAFKLGLKDLGSKLITLSLPHVSPTLERSV